MKILKPKIFSNFAISAGYTTTNFAIDNRLSRGLNFRFTDVSEFNISKELLAKEMSILPSQVKIGQQVHDNNIAIVEDFTNTEILNVDGLITNKTGILLGGKSADCCVVLLFDPIKKVIGAVHSGRAGAEKNIVSMGIN